MVNTDVPNTPHAGRRDVRVNVGMDSLREVNQSRVAVTALLVVNVPQIVAAMFVLSLHWSENTVCDAEHRLKWKLWSLVACVRMTLHLATIGALVACARVYARHTRPMVFLHNLRNFLDAGGLIWLGSSMLSIAATR